MNTLLVVLLVIAVGWTGVAHAADVVHINDHPYAFIADDHAVSIVDLSTPHAPLVVYAIPATQSWSSHIELFSINKSHYLVVHDSGDDSLQIFDVTNPYNPTSVYVMEHLRSHGTMTGLDIAYTTHDTLVLMAFGDTIHMLSVSDIKAPKIVDTASPLWSSYKLDDISQILPFEVHDDVSYALAVGKTSAQLINLDSPDSSRATIHQNIFGFDDIGEFADAGILKYDSRIYGILASHDSIIIADITSPRSPYQVGVISIEFDAHSLDMDIIDAHLLIFDGETLHIIDVNDVSQPNTVSSVPVGPGFDYVIGYSNGMHHEALLIGDDMLVLDVTDPAQVTPAYLRSGQKPLAPMAVETVIIQDRLYAVTTSSASNTIQIFDITDSDDIIPISEVAGGQFGYKSIYGPHDIEITQKGDKTYAIIPNVNSNNIVIIDISNPHAPVLVSSIHDIPEIKSPVGVEVFDVGSRSYVAVAVNFVNGVFLVDITDIHTPKPVVLMRDGHYGFEGLSGALGLESIVIDGTVYLLATGYYDGAIQIIDMTNPLSPSPIAAVFDGENSYNIGGAHQIKATTIESGTYAVVTSTYGDAITIIDITNPSSPVIASQITDGQDMFEDITSPQYLDIVLKDGHVFVIITSYYDASVNVIDITNPNSPIPVSSAIHDTDGFDMLGPMDISVEAYNGEIYAAVAAYFGNSLQVIDMSDLSAPKPYSLISSGIDSSVALYGSHGIGHVIVEDTPYVLSSVFSKDAVRITDISNPHRPVPVGILNNDELFVLDGPIGVTSGIISDRPYALISGVWSGSIQVIDMSNPHLPVPVSVIGNNMDDFEDYNGIVEANLAYIDERVYVVAISAFEDTVYIADLTDPHNPTHVSTLHDGIDGFTFSVNEGLSIVYAPSGVFAVVSGFNPGTIQIIDITDSYNPTPASSISTKTDNFESIGYMPDVTTVQVGDKIVMAAISYRTNTITLADITDPFNIKYMNTIQSGQPLIFIRNPESIESLTIGDQAFIAVGSSNDSVELINITDPYNPTLAGLAGAGLISTIYGVTDIDTIQIGSSHYILALTFNSEMSPIIEITNSDIKQVSVIPPVPLQ